MSAAADDVRVQEARRRLAAMPPDTELASMPPMRLVVQLVRAHGAAQMLDAFIRDHEPDGQGAEDTRRLAEIRGVLAEFDWETSDHQYALEAIEMIADGSEA